MRKRPLAVITALAFVALSPEAMADRDFERRFGETTHGDVRMVGNKLIDCNTADAGCAGGRNGTTQFFNNDHLMIFADVDGDPATFNSSAATLDLPDGATVRFAGLYWSANLDTSAALPHTAPPDETQRGTVKLDPPGAGGYQDITATVLDTPLGTPERDYGGFADVTSIVATAGEGEYTTANVQGATGNNAYAGWALVVAFEEASEPLRNLAVFDGYRPFFNNSAVETVSGFRTPLSGTVRTRLGAVTYEGEGLGAGGAGEALTVDGTPVGDALNPTDNFYNGTISALGSHLTEKDPHHLNQLGSIDIDVVATEGVLDNGITEAAVGFSAGVNDGIFAQVLTFATEVEQPLVGLDKTVADVDGGALRAGDVLEYAITAENTGNDAAEAVTITDPVPAGTTYVPGSLSVAGTPVTDAADADAGELSGDTITARLGTLAPAAERTVRFRARTSPTAAVGTAVVNVAEVDYAVPASTLQLSGESAPASTTVAERQPDPTPTVTPTPTPTPSPTAGPTPAPTVKPAPPPKFARLVVLPSTRRCVSRRKFRIRLVEPRGVKIVDAKVFVNGKRVRVVRGRRLRAPVDLRGLPKGRFKVEIRLKTADGRTIRGTRRYRTCATKRRSGRRPKV